MKHPEHEDSEPVDDIPGPLTTWGPMHDAVPAMQVFSVSTQVYILFWNSYDSRGVLSVFNSRSGAMSEWEKYREILPVR